MKKLALLLALVPLAAAAGGRKAPPPVTPSGPTLVPQSGLFLRNAFDTDPTEYIGAFVTTSDGVPDETAAAKLSCSNFVSWKEVDAGGVKTTDLFTASAGTAFKLGVPPLVGVEGGADRSATLLVQYTATRKWQAVVDDPGGFATCCATYPDQCRGRYVGEFLGGTGRIYAEVQSGAAGRGGAAGNGVAGELMAYGGRQWAYAAEFPNEVAFAFKLKDAPVSTGASFVEPICASDWMSTVPNDPRGHWERAVSDVMPDVAGAQQSAWDRAAVQMAKWCGVEVSAASGGARRDVGDGGSTTSRMAGGSEWSVAGQAVVSRMRLVCSETEAAEAARGAQHRFTGLYLLPRDQVEASCDALKSALDVGGGR